MLVSADWVTRKWTLAFWCEVRTASDRLAGREGIIGDGETEVGKHDGYFTLYSATQYRESESKGHTAAIHPLEMRDLFSFILQIPGRALRSSAFLGLGDSDGGMRKDEKYFRGVQSWPFYQNTLIVTQSLAANTSAPTPLLHATLLVFKSIAQHRMLLEDVYG
ncbi:unnamed protein product [Zymoseptoria tritici ST99CH_3D1]|nr:unnamed protein product [Zymoseptoria tritici ST99CH_3D1]